MKLTDLFCSSNASTAVTSSMHHRSMAPKRSKSYHYDRRKSQLLPHVPCSSQFPINPKPYFEKHRKSTSAEKHRKSTSSEKHNNSDMRRHSSVELSDLYTHHRHSTDGSSRRYLLGDDAPFIDWVSEPDKIPSMNPSHQHDATAKHMLLNKDSDDSPALIRSSSVRSRNQVVVLRVSLHCKACEGKVRKHISKMEGVTSFSIDMETKKVTIIGDVTPLRALASVSEVKSAQLWPYPTSTSTSSSSSSVLSSSSSSSIPQSPWST